MKEEITLNMGGGGVRQTYNDLSADFYRPLAIGPDTDVVLFTPDAGRAKDEYFIPNMHNGIHRIAAWLMQAGFDVETACTDIDNIQSAWFLINQHKPPVIGFSPYYNTMEKDFQNISHAGTLSPKSIIVVGGFEASLNSQWQKMNGLIDIVVLGEGEAPLLEIVSRMKQLRQSCCGYDKEMLKGQLAEQFREAEVAGVTVLGAEGVLYSMPMNRISQEFYRDINVNAMQHIKKSPLEKYWQLTREMFGDGKDIFFRFVTSDNCPFKCKFCQSSIFFPTLLGRPDKSVRYLEAEDIMEILTEFSRGFPDIKYVYIDDENFMQNRKRTFAVAENVIALKKAGTIRDEIRFVSRSRTNQISQELCVVLKAAGWEIVSVGSESYSQAELDHMDKKIRVPDNVKALSILAETGLTIAENYILFTPVTTKETFFESATQICDNFIKYKPDGAVTLFITPLPGTEYWGDGNFQVVLEGFNRESFFTNKVHFMNRFSGYEYLGYFLKVPKSNTTIAYPEIVLVEDELMRDASLATVESLPRSIGLMKQYLADNKDTGSRKYITLANLYSCADEVYMRTREKKAKELKKQIINTIRSL